MKSLAETFRRLEDASAWRRLAPWLTIDDRLMWNAAPARSLEEEAAASGRRALRSQGLMRVESALGPDDAASLARAVAAIHGEGLHPSFVYLYDEPWLLLGRILPLFARVLEAEVEPLEDVWAWHVDPRVDAGGWAFHRGWYEDVRAPDGLPSLINVWVSMTRATPRNACIHAVPLGDDPDWPRSLDHRPFDTSAACPLPTGPGSLLAWNANVLHSGGTCEPSCAEPRISVSFTLRRRGWGRCPLPAVPDVLPFRARLDLIAELMRTYGARDLPPEAPVLQWALATTTMRRLAQRTRPGH